jgi:arylsulfatase A-like enzyme
MGKQNNYDHSVHVPLIFKGPGIPAGQKCPAFCYLIDIYPTLCDLIGLELPSTVEGESLVPSFQDPEERIRDHLLFAYRDLHRSVMGSRFKLIEYVVEGKRTTQLFDLHEDPFELENLADLSDYSQELARLRGELNQWKDWDDWGENFWEGYE